MLKLLTSVRVYLKKNTKQLAIMLHARVTNHFLVKMFNRVKLQLTVLATANHSTNIVSAFHTFLSYN